MAAWALALLLMAGWALLASPPPAASAKISTPSASKKPAPLVLWGRGTLLDRDRSSVGFDDLKGMGNDSVALFLKWRNFTGNLPERYSGLASAGMFAKGLVFFIVFGAFLAARRWLALRFERRKAEALRRADSGEEVLTRGEYDLAIGTAPHLLFLLFTLIVFAVFGLDQKYFLAAAALIGGLAVYAAALTVIHKILFRAAPQTTGYQKSLVRLLRLLIHRIWRTAAWTLIPILTLQALSYKPGVIDLLWGVFRIGLAANVLSVLSRGAATFFVRKSAADGEEPKESLAIHALRFLLAGIVIALYTFYSFDYNNLTQYLLVGIFFSAFVIVIAWFLLTRIISKVEEAFSPREEDRPPSLLSTPQFRSLEVYALHLVRGVFYAGAVVFLLVLWGVDLYAVTWTFRLLSTPIAEFGGIPVSIGSLLKVGAIFFVFWWLSRRLRSFIQARMDRSFAGEAVRSNLSTGVGYLTMTIGIILGLKSIGVDFTTLTVLAGVLGIGIGFGLQNISNNLISGVILLIERTVKPGDFIEVGDTAGTVQQVSLRSTVVRTLDNIMVIVPNSNFVSNNVINWSHSDKITRGQIAVGVAYGSDTKLVRDCLLEAAKSIERVLDYPNPHVFFKEFGDSSLNFDLLFWYDEPKTMRAIKSELHFKVEKTLKENGVTIPFPQRDVHMFYPEDKPPPPAPDPPSKEN
jgi:small-conductance mechanosensitive channel